MTAPPDGSIARSRATRSEVGGWVVNSPRSPPAESGLTMNICAVAGLASAPSFTARCE